MSHPRRVEANQDDQATHRDTSDGCLTPTTIKVGAVVLGLLLVGAGLAMYFLHVNAIAAYITDGVGGATILGVAVWSIIDCLRGKNENSEREGNNSGVREVIPDLPDLSKIASYPQITENDVNELRRENFSTKSHIHSIYASIKCSSDYSLREAQNLMIKLGWKERTIVEIGLKKQNLDSMYSYINEIIDSCNQRSIIVFFYAKGDIIDGDGTINIRLVTLVNTDLQ